MTNIVQFFPPPYPANASDREVERSMCGIFPFMLSFYKQTPMNDFCNSECTDDAREFVCGKGRESYPKLAQSLGIARTIGGDTMFE